MNGMRVWLPVLLALSTNSPFWQGRDSGLASSRTPVFQAFPRVGIPREFADYADYVDAVDLLIRSEAVPEPTYLWWDVRPQPKLGTVEIRIMDAQTSLWQTQALVALVQCLCRLEAEGAAQLAAGDPRRRGSRREPLPRLPRRGRGAPDPARSGPPRLGRRAHRRAGRRLCASRPRARLQSELASVKDLCRRNGCTNQLAIARRVRDLPKLVEVLADEFAA